MIEKFLCLCRFGLGMLLLLCLKPVVGQDAAFHHLTVENGLLNNSVLSIAQDANGFLWFGTRSGLNRYDGTRFRAYKSNDRDISTLLDNNVMSLFCDSKQTLWIGSGSGLNKYNSRKDAFERIQMGTGAVFCIHEDQKGRLWVGAANGLYLLTDRQKAGFRSFSPATDGSGMAGRTVRAIAEDHAGTLWVGTNNGLTKLTDKGGVFRFETLRPLPGRAETTSVNYITAIAEDKSHRLWIGTQKDGVSLYDPATKTFVSFNQDGTNQKRIVNNNVRTLLAARDGKIWIGTQEGLSIVSGPESAVASYQHAAKDEKSLSQNSVYSLFQDASGSVWVGTYFGGVNTFFARNTSFHTLRNNEDRSSLSNNVVSSIVEDGRHNLWIGTEGGGLNYFDRVTGRFRVYKNRSSDASSLGSNLVKVVYLDRDGNPWIGTHGGGLNVFDRSTNRFKRFLFKDNDPASLTGEITSLAEDAEGRLWAVTNAGLKVFRRNKTSLEPLDLDGEMNPLPKGRPVVLFADAKQSVWLGAEPGLYRISGTKVTEVDTFSTVNCISADADGTLWFGLSSGGLAQYKEGSNFLVRLAVKQAPANVIGLLNDNKGNLWLSTDNGLVNFNLAQRNFQAYTVNDGLAGNEFNYNSYLRDSRGELFFGGFNGITHFFPDSIEINAAASPVVFTGLKLFNRTVDINGEDALLKEDMPFARQLQFRYNQDVFTLEFALLNFIKSSKNKYAYKLQGFDKDWIETTTPSATYTNLPPGTYTFNVKGANNDGVWSKPASLKITVLPPFWLTWWAYVIYISALGALLFFIARYFFLRALLKKEDELHRVKLNFFTNISHEIRTHLTLIMAPVEQLMEQKAKDGFVHQQLSQVKTNAARLLKLVSELMDFRKAETQHLKLHVTQHNFVAFLQDIYTSFRELSLAKNIYICYVHEAEEIPLYFDKEQLEKVFFNLLSNAFKFTPPGGRIVLTVEQKEETVLVSVKDNGRGIAPEYLPKLFTNFFQVADHGFQNTGYGIGLALSKHIVELHKGTITVESGAALEEKERRTVFTVVLRKGNEHFADTGFLLPAKETEKIAIATTETPSPAIPFNQIKEENLEQRSTILIVEDNAELRTLIARTFLEQYKVLTCENGRQGWEAAVEQIPDLVVSDVMMPEMDGFALCHQLKTDERTSHIPVVLLTAKTAQTDQVSGLSTGADVYLTKPFSTQVLALSVRNLLAAKERLRQKFSLQIAAEPKRDISARETVEASVVNAVDATFLNKVIQLVEEHMDDPEFGVEMLSKKVAMSAPVLYKKLKAVTNMSVNEFVKSLRLKKAARLLQQKNLTVYEVAYAVGYSDRKYFSKEFKKQFGKTPSEYAGVSEAGSGPA